MQFYNFFGPENRVNNKKVKFKVQVSKIKFKNVEKIIMPYINNLKVYLSFVFLVCVSSWNRSDLFSNFTSLSKLVDLRQQLILKTSISGDQYLIIFGGYSLNNLTVQRTVLNSLYKVNLATRQTTQLAVNKISKPSGRYNLCGTVVRDRFFIYGGYDKDSKLYNQLWEYDFLVDEWTQRGVSYNFTKCSFLIMTSVYSNDTLSIVGLLSENSTFKVVEYFIFNQTYKTNLTLSIYNSVSMQSKLWDGSSNNNYLRIQSKQDLVSKNFTSFSGLQFPIRYFCVMPYDVSNAYTMVTNNGVYLMSKIGSNYNISYFMEHNQEFNQEINCINVNQWNFFIYKVPSQANTTKYDIQIEYLNGKTKTGGIIYKDKFNLYTPWINPLFSYSIFQYNQALYILNQNLDLYYLDQTCYLIAQNQNVIQCVWGMFTCNDGWTGQNCSTPQCPGSLRILDSNNLTQIDMICSGNGQCLSTGCQCFKGWAGQKCQIYQKGNCSGTLFQNFILSNCQCNSPTVGGNQCTVVFCYNDCSGKGTCQQNGQCLCLDDYTGPDCSILKIGFDLI